MKEKDLNLLLQKADELKALFVLGQRVIPFLEEIFVFVKEIQPLLDEINQSVADNLNKMPGASEQLSKVTQANEMATVEIMDVVDGIMYKLDLMDKNSKAFFGNKRESINNSIKLFDILRRGILNNSDLKPAVNVINNTITNLEALNSTATDDFLYENKKMHNEIRNDANNIIMALQIQDITAQQIAAVNHMLGTIQHKLITILDHFHSTNIDDLVKPSSYQDTTVNVTKLHRDIAFDPNAVEALDKDLNRQAAVDEVIKLQKENGESGGKTETQVEDNVIVGNSDIESLINGLAEEKSQFDTTAEQDNIVVGNDDIDSILNSLQQEAEGSGQNSEVASDKNNENQKEDSLGDIDLSKFDNLDGDFSQEDIDALFK